jgi:hypothetical protein
MPYVEPAVFTVLWWVREIPPIVERIGVRIGVVTEGA